MSNVFSDGLRLVSCGDFLTSGGCELIRKAADEIERLRAIVEACAAECPPDDKLEVNERVAVLRAERDRHAAVTVAAENALAICRVGMGVLVKDGVRSQHFKADADQFAAAWRDLREAASAAKERK